MLLPDEIAAAKKQLSRTPLYLTVVTIIAIVCGFVPAPIYLSQEGRLDHLLGRDEAVTAAVEHVEEVGTCSRGRGKSTTKRYIEVSWDSGGERQSGGYDKCGGSVPAVGDNVELWVGPTGNIEDSSPAFDRFGLISVSLLLVAIVLSLGILITRTYRGKLLRLLTKTHGPFSQPTVVTIGHATKGRMWMQQGAQQTPAFGPRKSIALVLLNARAPGGTNTPLAALAGQWWLYLVHTNDPKYQIALLMRENNRCWIQFRR